jgi:Spy/CpxP family protein refolding chaperone
MLLFGLALAAGPAYAQGESSIMDQIGLSTQQREQIKTLTEDFGRQTATLRSDIHRLVEEEKRLKAASNPNEAALRKTLQERADKEIELSLALTRFNTKVENILTPAQRKKLETLRSQQNHR